MAPKTPMCKHSVVPRIFINCTTPAQYIRSIKTRRTHFTYRLVLLGTEDSCLYRGGHYPS